MLFRRAKMGSFIFVFVIAFIAGVIFDRKILFQSVTTDNLIENMLNRGSLRFGFNDLLNGFNGVEIVVNDNLMIEEICTYKDDKEDGICILLDLDEEFSIVNVDQYKSGYPDGVTVIYWDGRLSAIRYVLGNYLVGNAVLRLDEFASKSDLFKIDEAYKKSFTYEFLGEPKYINDSLGERYSYCYVFYNHKFPQSINVSEGCQWYSIKDNNVFCIGPRPRFSIVMVPTDFFEYKNDTLIVYQSSTFADWPVSDLYFYLFYFCPPTSRCTACVWELAGNDTICFRTSGGRSFINSDFYKPKKFVKKNFFHKEGSKTFEFVSHVYLKDTLFNVALEKFDTTTIILLEGD